MKTTLLMDIAKLGLGILTLLLSACSDKEAKQAKGFVLPEGDSMKGKQAFVELRCHRCHSVVGETFPALDGPSEEMLRLGGEVHKVKTYGQLVTAVINPEHVVSKEYLENQPEGERESTTSPMPSFNDTMTVEQMIDIVEFLHAHYVKLEPAYEGPPYYGP